MAHPYHHALSSVRTWGGAVEDYIPIHDWFDASKQIIADFRHRCLRHHAEGVFMAETIFGATITLSTGRVIPVRWIGEQHIREDLGFVPSFADWVKAIRPEPWMGRALKLDGGAPEPAVCDHRDSSPDAWAETSLLRTWNSKHCGHGLLY
jgi:hypothetical protein